MQSFLLEIWRGSGKTVVFVTHHIDEAVYLAEEQELVEMLDTRIK